MLYCYVEPLRGSSWTSLEGCLTLGCGRDRYLVGVDSACTQPVVSVERIRLCLPDKGSRRRYLVSDISEIDQPFLYPSHRVFVFSSHRPFIASQFSLTTARETHEGTLCSAATTSIYKGICTRQNLWKRCLLASTIHSSGEIQSSVLPDLQPRRL